jgi:hypothetical protein
LQSSIESYAQVLEKFNAVTNSVDKYKFTLIFASKLRIQNTPAAHTSPGSQTFAREFGAKSTNADGVNE